MSGKRIFAPMPDDTPQPLPGLDLVPRLLAYHIARVCEKDKVESLIVIVVNSEGVWDLRISSGVMAHDIAFAGVMLQSEAMRLSVDPLADDPNVEDEEDEE